MSVTSQRIRFILMAAIAAVAVLAATAIAATPKEGSYASSGQASAVSFAVLGSPPKIESFLLGSGTCDLSPLGATKSIGVKNNGKFRFEGKFAAPNADKFNVTLEGKFKTKTKAKGSIKAESCDKLNFTARLSEKG